MRWLTVFLLVACSTGSPGPGIDVDRAMGHVDALVAIGPRPGDTAAARDAATYIESQLTSLGAHVERLAVGGVDLPEIMVLGARRRAAKHVDTTDPDLLVRFGPTTGKALLVMAHYDTVPASPGAVDNAAAVGVLLELARVLQEHPPAQPVILAFTANEEIGLVGAEALAAQRGDEVAFAVALDLIGGSGTLVLNGASTLVGAAEMHWLADAADRAGIALRAPLAHRVVSRWWPQAERSDHGPFTRHGIPAVHFYNRGQDGEWIDLAYHSPADVTARVDRSSVDEIGRLLRALTDVAPPAHDGDAFWVPVAVNTVVPRWVLIIAEAVIALAALGLLALELAGAAGRVRLRGAGLFSAFVCYVVAVAAAFGAERLAAGDHPAPWLHAPLRAEVGETLVLVGVLGFATRIVARYWEWRGGIRYLSVAVILLLGFGTFWLAIGAAEIAWLWLLPALLAAAGPRIRKLAPLAILGTLVTPVLVLAPPQLREAAWNGFLPSSLPLAAWLGLLLAPPLATTSWWLRRPHGPLRTLLLPLGCALAIAAGVGLLFTAPDVCSASDFQRFHLACELGPTWR